jgi:hypothetical protein
MMAEHHYNQQIARACSAQNPELLPKAPPIPGNAAAQVARHHKDYF